MSGRGFFQTGGDGILLFVRVTPRASKDAIEGVVTDADGNARLAVRLRAVPEDGKANKALIALLAKSWKIPKSAIEVVSGFTMRQKTLKLTGADDAVAATLQTIGAGKGGQEQ